MWQRLERNISFLNCVFVYSCFFFLPSVFLVFFPLTFFYYPHFFHPHFSIHIFPSASAIRRYPVRVLQTPTQICDWMKVMIKWKQAYILVLILFRLTLPEIQDILLPRLNRSAVSVCSTAHALWSLVSCLRLHVKYGQAESKSAAWISCWLQGFIHEVPSIKMLGC